MAKETLNVKLCSLHSWAHACLYTKYIFNNIPDLFFYTTVFPLLSHVKLFLGYIPVFYWGENTQCETLAVVFILWACLPVYTVYIL